MKASSPILIIPCIALLISAAFILLPGRLQSGPGYLNEKTTFRNLKAYADAQAVFRAKTYGGNEKRGFWRDDIAGLYAHKGADGRPIRLIELSTATADSQPVTKIEWDGKDLLIRSAKAGYWYRALSFRDEVTPIPNRFAACAYPDTPSAGKWMYIISEKNLIYRKPFHATELPRAYPEDPEKEGWESRDESKKY